MLRLLLTMVLLGFSTQSFAAWQTIHVCENASVGENEGKLEIRVQGNSIQARGTKTDLARSYDSGWVAVADQGGYGYDSADLKFRVTIYNGELLEGFFNDASTNTKVLFGNHIPCK